MVGDEGSDVAGDDAPALAFPPEYFPAIPDIKLNITSETITAKPRKLGTWAGPENAQDLRALWKPREADVVDRMAALVYSDYRKAAEIIAKLPDDLIPPDVIDMALGNILKQIPQKYWPHAYRMTESVVTFEQSVIGRISKVIKDRGLNDVGT